MRTKQLVMLLIGCLMMTLGAGVSVASAQKITIDFQILDTGPDYQKAYKEIIKLFEEKNPQVKVRAIHIEWDKGHEKLLVRIAAKNAPEVAQFNDDFIGDYYARGLLRPLEDYGCNLNWDILFPAQEEVTRFNGKHYSLAIANKGRAVWYNIDKFKEAGLEELPRKWPSEEWTWDTFLSYCKRLTTEDTWGTSFMYTQEPYDWLSSAAPKEYGELSGLIVEGTFRGNEKWCVDALQWFADLSLVHKVASPYDLDAETGGETLWRTGKVAMIRTGSWFLDDVKREPVKFKWNVGPMPLKNRADIMTSMVNFGLPVGSKHPEIGGKFLKFLMTPKVQRILVKECGLMPADVFTAISPVWTEQEGIPDNVDLTMFVKGMFHNRFDFFHIPGWYEAKKIFKRTLQPIWTGKVTAEEQMKKIKPEIDAALARVRKEL